MKRAADHSSASEPRKLCKTGESLDHFRNGAQSESRPEDTDFIRIMTRQQIRLLENEMEEKGDLERDSNGKSETQTQNEEPAKTEEDGTAPEDRDVAGQKTQDSAKDATAKNIGNLIQQFEGLPAANSRTAKDQKGVTSFTEDALLTPEKVTPSPEGVTPCPKEETPAPEEADQVPQRRLPVVQREFFSFLKAEIVRAVTEKLEELGLELENVGGSKD